jgi:hypothetical protein
MKSLALLLAALVLSACTAQESTHPKTDMAQAPTMLQCEKDTDCKGDRICDSGSCRAPTDAAAPSQPSGALQPVQMASTHSECQAASLIFSCTTTKHKRVEVCDSGSKITYSFGKLGSKPELALSIPRASASSHQWDGMGPMSYSVNIPNGNTVYSVFWTAQRDPDAAQPISAGVDVQIDGASAATVECVPDTAQQNIEEIDLPPAQA